MSRFFTISEGPLSDSKLAEYETLRAKFIVSDPTEDLKCIYEVNRLADLIGMRAEKYESPENQYLLASVTSETKTRTVQNPNFDQLVNLLKTFRTTPDLKLLKRLVEFLEGLALPRLQAELAIDSKCLRNLVKWPVEQRARFDVRFCFRTSETVNYLYNHYVIGTED